MVAASIANINHGAVGGGHDRQSGKIAGLIAQPEAAAMLNVSERLLRKSKQS